MVGVTPSRDARYLVCRSLLRDPHVSLLAVRPLGRAMKHFLPLRRVSARERICGPDKAVGFAFVFVDPLREYSVMDQCSFKFSGMR